MPVQTVGNQPRDATRFKPSTGATNNPRVFSRLNDPSARNWDSLGRPTNLPSYRPQPQQSAYDRYIAGRQPVTPSSTPVAPRGTTGGFNTGQLSSGGMPARSGTSPQIGRSNFNPADYALRPQSPGIIPDAAPIPSMGRSPIVPSSAPSRLRIPGLRIPPGLGRLGQGLGALGAGLGAIGEGGRLGQLIADPANYWGEQDRQMREQYPFLYPPAGARPGLDSIPRAALPIAPFSGGQSPGVSYQVTSTYTYSTGYPPQQLTANFVFTATGPIGGVVMQSTDTNKNWYVATGTGLVFLLSTALQDSFASAGIVNITRSDGQPDTGGDPPPIPNPDGQQRPSLAPPTAPFSPPAPAALPGAVPFNNPQLEPLPGSLPAPSNAPLPNPLAPPAPEPDATPSPRTTPTARPGAAPPEPGSNANPANPASRTFRSPPLGQGRLAQEGRMGESMGDYTARTTNPVDQLHDLNEGQTPGILPAVAMVTTLLIGQRLANRSPNPATDQGTTPGSGTGTDTPTPFCRFHEDYVSHQKLDAQFGRIQAMEAFQTAFQDNMNTKLGPQIPNGGISGKLGSMGRLISKTWNFLQIDRVLNVLTWIGVIHNGYMLSNNLAQTLFSAIGNVLDVFGIQQIDEDGNESPYDIQEMVNKWIDDFGKQAFGLDQWQGFKAEWKAFNRIYQAAANIIYSLQSITYSMVEMLELISNNIGKVGNALKRSGTVLQNSFNWMNPNANFTNNRFFNALNNAEEAVENIDQVASETLSIQQTGAELYTQKTEFETALNAGQQAISTSESASAGASTKPLLTINPSDERKADQ